MDEQRRADGLGYGGPEISYSNIIAGNIKSGLGGT